jgi:hypothetical protein
MPVDRGSLKAKREAVRGKRREDKKLESDLKSI